MLTVAKRRWAGSRVCFLILSNTFVHSFSFTPTHCFVHMIQLIFTEHLSSVWPDFSGSSHLFNIFILCLAAFHLQSTCSVTSPAERNSHLLLILLLILKSLLLVHSSLHVDWPGLFPLHFICFISLWQNLLPFLFISQESKCIEYKYILHHRSSKIHVFPLHV